MRENIRCRLTLFSLIIIGSLVLPVSFFKRAVAQEPQSLRLGLIGLDTSHVLRFTELLNDSSRPDHVPGARVVAAFKGGSPDVKASATRIEQFTTELRDKWKVELVGSIEELCQKVDAVLLMSVDGRVHLEQARPVFAAKKRVFIDKPFAASYADAHEITRLARESGTPFFSSSSLRFQTEIQSLKQNPELGEITGAITYGPAPFEPHHPDLFWYGIHSVESLYTLMGPDCETVTRTHTEGADVVVGRWKDGRIGVVRGARDGAAPHGTVAFGRKTVMTLPLSQSSSSSKQIRKSDYYGIVSAIVKFFQTGTPPVSPEETLEIMAFMEAADISKTRRGEPVGLKEVMQGRAGKATSDKVGKR